MAIRDMVSTTTSLAMNTTLDIKPTTAGEEWIVHNIYIDLGSEIEVYRWYTAGGSSPLLLITKASHSLLSQQFHCSSTQYLVIKNIGTSTAWVSYDGIVTNT